MASLLDSMGWGDEETDMSAPLCADTQIASEIASDDSLKTPKLPVRTICGKRYLEVDQSASCRAGSKISSIWQYGRELRYLDSSNLDKY